MNPFAALKNLSPFQLTSRHFTFFTYPVNPSLHFTLLNTLITPTTSLKLCVLTGRGDDTVCFHCGGGLREWKETDEPWSEHAAWFPKCLYVNHIKGMQFIRQSWALKTAQGVEVCTDLMYYRTL
jgi:hypothetical protein